MFRFAGEQPKSAIPDDFKKPKLLQIFAPEQNISFMTPKKLKKLSEYLKGVMDKIDPENLEFDMRTIPPPPKILTQDRYAIGDGVHANGVNRYVYFVTQDI